MEPSHEMSFSENKNTSNMVYRDAGSKFEFKDLTESI